MNKGKINIIEVGPRDGLQNVRDVLSVDQKARFIQYLLDCGFEDIEAGSFVRADRVPAMAGSDEIASRFQAANDRLWYLAPNLKGLESALKAQTRQIALFTATSEAFNKKNIGLSVNESVAVIQDCVDHLRRQGYQLVSDWGMKPASKTEIKLRLYISTVIACPYEGPQDPAKVSDLISRLLPLGFAQISLGDTIGVGTPAKWKQLLARLDQRSVKQNKFALHCHDTYGTALACVAEGLNQGLASFDSSAGGLGGCPYAKGATGNLATEDLIYFLQQEGYKGLPDLNLLLEAFHPDRTGALTNLSRAGSALKARQAASPCP